MLSKVWRIPKAGSLNRVLVTGAQGFLGAHLVSALRARDASITTLVRSAAATPDGSVMVECDLGDRDKLASILAAGNFDAVFHLAALNASAGAVSLYQTNVVGTAILLESVKALGRPDVRVVLVGSSAEYGACPDDPITEQSPAMPVGDYGISKLAATRMGQLHHALGQATIMIRPFNMVGPGRSAHLLHSDVARKIVAMEAGSLAPMLHMRNLGGFRDFVDVRDVAAGLVSAATAGDPGQIYNLCTEMSVQAREVVDTLVQHATVPITVEALSVAPGIGDVPRQRGSFQKARNTLGWAPAIGLEKSLLDTLDYWRKTGNSAHSALPVGNKHEVPET
jgi:GDP-4-dehydro-6-deoxy-D-mannose reductase